MRGVTIHPRSNCYRWYDHCRFARPTSDMLKRPGKGLGRTLWCAEEPQSYVSTDFCLFECEWRKPG